MAENTSIGWTDHTCNFWWGCFKVSPGCTNCYAESFSKRLNRDIWGPPETTFRWLTKGPWTDIVKWDNKARERGVREKVFVSSMADFFEPHPQVNLWRPNAIEILENLTNLDVQLLTKRPENVWDMVPMNWLAGSWPEHIWLGVSAEDQKWFDKRVSDLESIPASIKFVSIEPLLGPIDHLHPGVYNIDWVIVGGESGKNARPMELRWAYSVINRCAWLKIPVFFKQTGSVLAKQMGLQHPKGEDPNEWPKELKIQQFPQPQYVGPQYKEGFIRDLRP